ncbi:extracellular solute-binding protein [Candidatus Nomurabacteria bacterium]|nr:extracellular solute-binding protein [Candidatus Nomurabacteria bacterium]
MKLRPFELGLVIVFAGLAIGALILLTSYKGDGDDPDGPVDVGTVEIWGTLPAEGINALLGELTSDIEEYRYVSYTHFTPEAFDQKLLTALADGVGPDLILVSHEKLAEMRGRIQPIPYEGEGLIFPLRDIRDQYLEGAQIFALSDGLYGYPIAVDPLMMYWNRDILATEGFLTQPQTWENLVNTVLPRLVKRDFDRTIERSVVAMGEYQNIRNAFGIISMLLIQGGTSGVVEDGGRYSIQLQNSPGSLVNPLEQTVDFYTRFSKPNNSWYSWNRSFGEDRQQFVAEDLVLYFGYGSEAPVIGRINPNLNFDIAEVPQGEAATVRRTYGKFYALSLLKSTDNLSGAYQVWQHLGQPDLSARIALASNMVPAYRSLVAAGSNDTYGRVTYQSASIAYGWLNPDLDQADKILETMVEDVNENRYSFSSAASDASARLQQAF